MQVSKVEECKKRIGNIEERVIGFLEKRGGTCNRAEMLGAYSAGTAVDDGTGHCVAPANLHAALENLTEIELISTVNFHV
ncbi:hypothetical protein KY316_03475, partial [Candidatus Woesearchaeota archaeon]|nr:hypothetical protein [Candidatus Woesearchaeota archaeon]